MGYSLFYKENIGPVCMEIEEMVSIFQFSSGRYIYIYAFI